jgi:hypothetical protein
MPIFAIGNEFFLSFAEGSTQSGFETWILIQNPNDSPANVNMTYLTPTGPLTDSQQLLTLMVIRRYTFIKSGGKWPSSVRIARDNMM